MIMNLIVKSGDSMNTINSTLGMKLSLLHITLLIVLATGDKEFRFANYYGDNMVLQRGTSASGVVWGYISTCSQLTATFGEIGLTPAVQKEEDTCTFTLALPYTDAGGPYVITVSDTSDGTNISLSNVYFGDVWVCGGQSNMVFTVPQAYNATEEIAKADLYPEIRLFTVQRVSSATPLREVPVVLQPWSVASSKTINGGPWQYFSATCWFYAQKIYDQYKIPLGLISSNWGGTIVEAWSSPDALAMCSSKTEQQEQEYVDTHKYNTSPNPNTPSVLWNAMINPLLNMTIYGVIWYQGESNAGNPTKYNCSFPAMITDWRSKWQSNAVDFPFGFVQLSAVGTNNKSEDGFAGIRWSQTAGYGYVPNPALTNVFMAVSMDLGDPTSPFGSVHPRDKETVGERLALAGRAIAYGEKSIYYTGPIVSSASNNIVTFRNVPEGESIELQSQYGFEAGCTNGSTPAVWVPGIAKSVQNGNSVVIDFPECPAGNHATMIRYSWMEDPCPYMKCAVYCKGLPSPPFVIDITQ